jgi:hypothetical protein
MTAEPRTPVDVMEELYGFDARRANYLTHISWRYRYSYVEVPKTGCTSIKRMLQLAEVDYDVSRLAKNIHDRQHSPLASPMATPYRYESALDAHRLFVFSVVRNPFTRALSGYLDKIVETQWERERRLPQLGFSVSDDVSFFDFLKRVSEQQNHERDIHWAPQSYLLGGGGIHFDHIGRFENLREEIAVIADRIGILIEPSLMLRTTAHATNADSRLEDFLGEREADLILEIYAQDFARFEYDTDPPS